MTEPQPDFVNSLGNAGLKVFGGTSNPVLVQEIAESLGTNVGIANIERFPDGETLIKLEDDVRGRDCFVVQSTCPPVKRPMSSLANRSTSANFGVSCASIFCVIGRRCATGKP